MDWLGSQKTIGHRSCFQAVSKRPSPPVLRQGDGDGPRGKMTYFRAISKVDFTTRQNLMKSQEIPWTSAFLLVT